MAQVRICDYTECQSKYGNNRAIFAVKVGSQAAKDICEECLAPYCISEFGRLPGRAAEVYPVDKYYENLP